MKHQTSQTPGIHILVIFFLLTTYSLGVAQNTDKEQKAIEDQVDAFFTSWNNHDFREMQNYIDKDCDFVNIVGMHWKGREDIQYAHQSMHEAHFKDVPLEKRSVSVRFVKPDLAIAHVLMHPLKTFVTPDGTTMGKDDALATFVFVKKGPAWLVVAVENVVVDEKAKPFNPVTMRNNQKKDK
jgi:uncharacterized protein (TIGR02246 family)